MPFKRWSRLAAAALAASPLAAADTRETAPVAFEWFEYAGRDARFAEPVAPGSYRNPILAGFYPDPSLTRVGGDFYLVTSSFAYAPGIPIFHSRDLVHWRQLGHVLERPSQLRLQGLGVSRGVFAPALSHHRGTFYLANTMVDGGGNFFVTATDPAGPWSDPVWLPEVDGIDPSFFFDDDGRAYLLNNGPPPGGKPLYDGHRAIWIQEFDPRQRKLVGPRSIIVDGGVDISKQPIWIEGPHLFRRGSWYYLICAEGGTGLGHSEVVFRSRSPTGPFVPWERNPILTQRDLPAGRPHPVSSTGHADLVEAPDGSWWAVFLGCRPYQGDFYNTGRETFLLPVTWVDDWPSILPPQTPVPPQVASPTFAAPDPSPSPLTGNFAWRDEFDRATLDPAWNLLRSAADPPWDLRTKPGALLLTPRRETLGGTGTPAFVGRRQQHTTFDAALRLLVPRGPEVSAGIAAFQNETHHFFLGVRRTVAGPEVFLERADSARPPETVARAALPGSAAAVSLKISGDGAAYSFFHDADGRGWRALREREDGRLLSTAVAGGFVGTYLGPYARLASAATDAAPATPPPGAKVSTFPLSRVRLLDGPFSHAQELNLAYLRSLDVDRLLAPFRTEAGLPARAVKYPNWESSGLEGHTAGHYLTALAQAWAATGEAEFKRRLDYLVGELAGCQKAQGDGYVGAVPGGRRLWAEVAAGELRVEGFAINGKWVPWYNLHKLFAGLRDAHLIGESAPARDVLLGLAGWCAALTARLSDAQVQEMLRAEHGGMNEVLADVFALTRDPKHLALAERFSHRALLDPLHRREDRLDGLHANTQIPKVIGCARIAELRGEPDGCPAAPYFWEAVVRRRTVAIGGNSVREHFNPAHDFSSMVESREGPETCNTYNMLRLTEQLFRGRPAASYADFYERALYNHILSSQHPGHGGFVYFTPMRPRHYRVYSHPSQGFWCCVGSGMESHGKHGRFVYAHSGDDLYVNLFIASTLDWPERGLRVRQDTAFPDEPRTRLRLTLGRPLRFTLRVRHPGWVDGALQVRVNGRPRVVASQPVSYAAITRLWRDGDRVDVELPMRTRIERLPDGSDYVAILHGPLVLAAETGRQGLDGLIADDGRMAHLPAGPELPLDSAPTLAGNVDTLAAQVPPVPGRPLTFQAPAIIRPEEARGLELVPFFRVHDSRYILYWRVVAPAAGS
jgi:hypothetical protein